MYWADDTHALVLYIMPNHRQKFAEWISCTGLYSSIVNVRLSNVMEYGAVYNISTPTNVDSVDFYLIKRTMNNSVWWWCQKKQHQQLRRINTMLW